MASGLTIRIKGLEELDAKMLQMQHALGYQRLQAICFDAVKEIRDLALANVRAQTHKLTGNLEKSLIAQPSKSQARPGAWTKAKWATAPHAHLIEFGHRIVSHSGADTGKVARAFPFFRPAVDTLRSKIKLDISDAIKRLLEGRL